METHSRTDKFGLVGHPIADSLSPRLFKAGYGDDSVYDLIDSESFEECWNAFIRDYKAVNVTAPFKEKAFGEVMTLTMKGEGSLSGPAARIGATNLVVKTPSGIEAHNSDFTGIIVSVAEAYYPGIFKEFSGIYGEKAYIKVHQFFKAKIRELFIEEPQALIVGLGGAGKAAAVAAAEMGFATVLMNRTIDKANAFKDALPQYRFIVDPLIDFKAALTECDLVIYTLPVRLDGIGSLSADNYAGETSNCEKGKVILEANYKTPSFDDEEQGKILSASGKYVSGKKWLLYQAATGYSLMTGEAPDLEKMLQVTL